jgi:hypothetical protein
MQQAQKYALILSAVPQQSLSVPLGKQLLRGGQL